MTVPTSASVSCGIRDGRCVCAQLCLTLWDPVDQAPRSVGFSRQEYWSEETFPSPGDLPDAGIEPGSPALQADSLPSEPPRKLSKAHSM